MTRAPILMAALLLGAGCPPKNQPIENPAAGTGETPTTGTPAVTETAAPVVEELPPDAELWEQVSAAANLLADDATRARGVTTLQSLKGQHPDNAYIVFNLGVAAYLSGDEAGARAAFQRSLEIDPTLGQAWVYLGALEERANRLDVAASSYRSGLAKDPENQDLWASLVGVLRKQGKPDEAVAEARKALKINANNVGVYNNLGLIYLDQGKLPLAKFVFIKALNSIPNAADNAYIQANLGRVYFAEKNYPQARYHLDLAIQLDPTFVPALIYMSHLHLDNRNYADMVPILEGALKQEPNNHSVIVNLGVAYRGMDRLDDAIAMYKKALEIRPADPQPHFNLGIVYGDYKKDYAQAITSFQAYVDAGGKEKATALGYIEQVKKEKEKAEAKAARDQKAKQREKERKERERLLEEAKAREAAEAAKAAEGGSTGGGEEPPSLAPDAPAEPSPEPTPEPAPEEGSP